MFFQNFWPPDMKMPDTLKKEEKTSAYPNGDIILMPWI